MTSWLAKLFGRSDGLLDGALVGVLFHKKGILFEPHERRVTARGVSSNETMEPETWTVHAPDTDVAAMGQAALAAFARVRTVEGQKEGMRGRPGYANEVRAALGLKPRVALWSAAGRATLSVAGDQLNVRPLRPDGAAGTFVFINDHSVPPIPLCDATPERVGTALSLTRDLVLPRR